MKKLEKIFSIHSPEPLCSYPENDDLTGIFALAQGNKVIGFYTAFNPRDARAQALKIDDILSELVPEYNIQYAKRHIHTYTSQDKDKLVFGSLEALVAELQDE